MIDPHVHLRDWNQGHKETVSHGLQVACGAGLDGVFEMPNTDPPIISRELALKRISLADGCEVDIFHGVFLGLTAAPQQVKEAVQAHQELFPRVVGLKLFAGSSTGHLAVTGPGEQQHIIKILAREGYRGVLAAHCEKEVLLKEDLWDCTAPFSHTLARPPQAEVESVMDMVKIAEEAHFKGTLHICHISVPGAVHIVQEAKRRGKISLTCGITPHHALLYDELMREEGGMLLKVNPPLRPKYMQKEMLNLLLEGAVDWIETDHAPHTFDDKCDIWRENPCASGLPGLPFYPAFIHLLREKGITEAQLERLTHHNIEEAFHVAIPSLRRVSSKDYTKEYEAFPGKFLYT